LLLASPAAWGATHLSLAERLQRLTFAEERRHTARRQSQRGIVVLLGGPGRV
jgi:hypothetical protein